MTAVSTRRAFLRLAAAAALGLPLAACGKRGALEKPPTAEEIAADQARAAGQPGAARPRRRGDTRIVPPRRETPFDFLL